MTGKPHAFIRPVIRFLAEKNRRNDVDGSSPINTTIACHLKEKYLKYDKQRMVNLKICIA